MSTLRRVLGVDPGSVVTGYGIVDTDGVRSFHVAHGHFRTNGADFPARLGFIHTSLVELIQQWQPVEAGIEQVFVSNNPMSALKLGQARGAAICAIVSQGLGVAEYPPRQVKQAIVGTGSADKRQVQTMIRTLLSLNETLQADAADGLAVALCHAHTSGGLPQVAGRRRSRGRGLRM